MLATSDKINLSYKYSSFIFEFPKFFNLSDTKIVIWHASYPFFMSHKNTYNILILFIFKKVF